MRLPCPFCGDRDIQEFVYRGDAGPERPSEPEAMADYVYLRDNVLGEHREHWYHLYGCRAWLVVARDTRTHAVIEAVFAAGVHA